MKEIATATRGARRREFATLSVGYVAYLRLGANFERHYASDAPASVVLLGLWLYAANIALLVGYRVARSHLPPEDGTFD